MTNLWQWNQPDLFQHSVSQNFNCHGNYWAIQRFIKHQVLPVRLELRHCSLVFRYCTQSLLNQFSIHPPGYLGHPEHTFLNILKYSGDLNTGLVWYSNSQKLSDRQIIIKFHNLIKGVASLKFKYQVHLPFEYQTTIWITDIWILHKLARVFTNTELYEHS